jgi:hypothetical protein
MRHQRASPLLPPPSVNLGLTMPLRNGQAGCHDQRAGGWPYLIRTGPGREFPDSRHFPSSRTTPARENGKGRPLPGPAPAGGSLISLASRRPTAQVWGWIPVSPEASLLGSHFKCDTGVGCESLDGRAVSEALSRRGVEVPDHVVDVGVGVLRQGGPAKKVAAEAAVGILDRPALPGAVVSTVAENPTTGRRNSLPLGDH